MNTQVKTTLYHECPCCHSIDADYGECDTRNDSKPNHEWIQHMTCNTCKSKFISVFHHVCQEIVEDNSFNQKQENARNMILARIRSNTLKESDIKLLEDILENSELVPDRGFQLGVYALAEFQNN